MFMTSPNQTLYTLLGGDEGLRKIVGRFYAIMDELPEVRGLREMHVDLPRAEEKLFDFLSGWTGGPPRFVDKYGHPMLRARHMPFKIGKSERDQWMVCMVKAVDESGVEEPVRSEFLHALLRLADHMRNQSEE